MLGIFPTWDEKQMWIGKGEVIIPMFGKGALNSVSKGIWTLELWWLKAPFGSSYSSFCFFYGADSIKHHQSDTKAEKIYVGWVQFRPWLRLDEIHPGSLGFQPCLLDPKMWVFPKIMGKPPKSSISIGFSIIFTIHVGVPLFLETPMYFGKTIPFDLIQFAVFFYQAAGRFYSKSFWFVFFAQKKPGWMAIVFFFQFGGAIPVNLSTKD